MNSYNEYEIFSGDELVAIWENNKLTIVNDRLLPLYLKKIQNADMWLETRAIDSHRANSRLLKKALRLTDKDDVSTVIHVNAATITDNYWIRPLGSELKYSDVKFSDDYFSNLALKGGYDSFNKAANSKRSRTPELTNTGSFEKCWKLRRGKWYMYKKATHNEMFSELFAYRLGEKLGFNMAKYERGEGYIKTLDFTDSASVNFEPASTFMGDNEDYIEVVKALCEICPDAIPDYIRLVFLDTIIANPDRHTNNFGLLRDVKTGKLMGLAPNYDNNMALISRGYPSKAGKSDMLITLFNELIDEFPEYKKVIPDVSADLVRSVVAELHMRVKTQAVIDIVMSRYEFVR